MAMVVPWASCYGQCSVQPLQLFGRGPVGADYYMSLFTYHGPRNVPRPRLAYHGPKMTLRQICRMLKVMRQVKNKEAAAANSRKQVSAVPAPASPSIRSDRRCIPICFRRRRNTSNKRVG